MKSCRGGTPYRSISTESNGLSRFLFRSSRVPGGVHKSWSSFKKGVELFFTASSFGLLWMEKIY